MMSEDYPGPSQRLIDAFARGEVTKGGLAEAGWFDVGILSKEGVVMRVKPYENQDGELS